MQRQISRALTGRLTKWLVLLFWVVVLVLAMPLAGKLSEVQDNQNSSWLPGSSESSRALTKLEAFQDPDDIPTVLVWEKRSGLSRADLATAAQRVAEVTRLPGAQPLRTPDGRPLPEQAAVQVSRDHQAAQAMVTFNFGSEGWNRLPDTADRIHRIADIPGAALHLAGPGGQGADSAKAFSGIDGKLLMGTVIVVIVVLLLTYRSPLLWLLPVISAGVALTVAQAVVYLLAKDAGLTVNGQSQGILTVLVFGASTDYALLLVARYREELRRHEDRHEAMGFALHRAAPAIIASAMTVVLGMLCLLVAEMNSTAGLGPVSAVGIAVGLLVMITLLPALLVITGRWVFWPRRPTYGSGEPTHRGIWARTGNTIARRPRTVWLVTAGALALCTLGVLQLNATGLSTKDSYTKEFDSIKGEAVLTRHHLVTDSNPVLVVTDAGSAQRVRAAMSAVEGLGPVSPPVVKKGTAMVQASLTQDPTSPAAADMVDRVRTAVHGVRGADPLVGGNAAVLDDVNKASARDNLVVMPLVLAVVLLVLILLLRALVAPVLLILTVVLSFGASLGLSALIFRQILGFAGADPSVPLFVFVFLVALGIDYNIFLMSRVREETPDRGTHSASLTALAATGGVITSAGLVLAATFGVLTTMPLVTFAEIGIAVALGVLLDTLVVRSVLVTALNLDLGSRIWWPSRMDRGHTRRADEQAERVAVREGS